MNPGSTGSYVLHKSNSLTNIVFEENVQPRVNTFVQKRKPQIGSRQDHKGIWETINESPLTHPSVNSAKAIGIREDSQLKPALIKD